LRVSARLNGQLKQLQVVNSRDQQEDFHIDDIAGFLRNRRCGHFPHLRWSYRRHRRRRRRRRRHRLAAMTVFGQAIIWRNWLRDSIDDYIH